MKCVEIKDDWCMLKQLVYNTSAEDKDRENALDKSQDERTGGHVLELKKQINCCRGGHGDDGCDAARMPSHPVAQG